MTSGDDAPRLQFVSTSSASDGSFIAISEIGALLKGEPHRLVGDVAVVLHQYRLGIDHPIRATADADFGVPPYALKDDSLVDATLTDGSSVSFDVALPDLASLLGLKLHARRVRSVDRDAVDLWTCLELLAAAGETAAFGDADFDAIRERLAN